VGADRWRVPHGGHNGGRGSSLVTRGRRPLGNGPKPADARGGRGGEENGGLTGGGPATAPARFNRFKKFQTVSFDSKYFKLI
jgi:hypothetical protein